MFKSLLQCETVHTFLEIMEDVIVAKNLTIEDIMTSKLITTGPDAILMELTDLFYRHNLSCIPVVVDDKFIGEVTISGMLKVGLPNYAMMIGNLNFLSFFTPFENLLINEERILVKEIMRKPSIRLQGQQESGLCGYIFYLMTASDNCP